MAHLGGEVPDPCEGDGPEPVPVHALWARLGLSVCRPDLPEPSAPESFKTSPGRGHRRAGSPRGQGSVRAHVD